MTVRRPRIPDDITLADLAEWGVRHGMRFDPVVVTDPTEVLIGEIVQADFEDPDYPNGITVTVLLNEDARVGHWFVRMQRIVDKPTEAGRRSE